MEEKGKGRQKPLRPTSNTKRDIYDTYMKNEGGRSIPVSDDVEEQKENNMKEQQEEERIEQEIAARMEEEYDENEKEDPGISAEEAKALVEQLNKLEAEREELKDQVIRKAAELENVRRRTQKEKQEMIYYANQNLLFKFLELMDDMQAAYVAANSSKDFDSLLTGLEMINKKANKLFVEAGVKPMDNPVGKEFDVDFHEALMTQPSEEIPEGHVIQVIQQGYMINERVLRHAKVITSAGPENK